MPRSSRDAPSSTARRGVTLSFRFRARASVDVRVKLVHGGDVKRSWILRRQIPYRLHRLRWSGLLAHGRAARHGRYRFKLQRAGHHAHPSPAFRLYDGMFPVRGPTRLRRPGAALRRAAQRRAGPPGTGRVRLLRHPRGRGPRREGAGSRLGPRALRQLGGDRRRGTKTDYRYAHFLHPASVHDGERVQDGPADRPHRQDRQRPHGGLPAPLRGLAEAGARPAPRGSAADGSSALIGSRLARVAGRRSTCRPSARPAA